MLVAEVNDGRVNYNTSSYYSSYATSTYYYYAPQLSLCKNIISAIGPISLNKFVAKQHVAKTIGTS